LTAQLAQGGRLLGARSAWLAAAGVAAGVGVAWLISHADPSQGTIPDVPLALPVAVLVGWSLIGSGLLATRSRREDHLALALIFTASPGSRACWEALQNVAKYAQASAAHVTLRPDGQWLAFTVEDDGQGFDPATTPRGTGLQGIADRLGALGGTADVTSAPGSGTRVTGRVPGTELA
jgi:hypothetical protein